MQRMQPESGQESVWDYPRPPAIVPTHQRIRVLFNGELVADTTRAIRILETSHPPCYYIPPEDVVSAYLTKTSRQTFCEYKGVASYWSLHVNGRVSRDAAWSYESPTKGYETITAYYCFYANRVDECFVDDERVTPQPGDFYGGWITSNIVGPFKGGPGTVGW